MADELPRPGVEVIQSFRTATPSFGRPALVPCVVGPAFEVLKVLTPDGTLNPKAKWGTYAQLGRVIPQLALPDPRGNLAELNVLEASIRPFLLAGGQLTELPMNPGEGFLKSVNGSTKAAFRTAAFGAGLNLDGLVLVVAFDVPGRTDTSEDVVVPFVGTLTAQQCADAINSAVGINVASVVSGDVVQLASPTFGALSSVTVRASGSANSVLAIGYNGGAAREERVEGAGWRAQDDVDNDTLSPWVEFYVGDFFGAGASLGAVPARMGQLAHDGTFTSAKAAVVQFGTAAGRIPLKVGDTFHADGVKVKSAEVLKVEESRFRLGVINVARSTVDDQGRYVLKSYDSVEVETLFDASPFAPKYAFFRAAGLKSTGVSPTAASRKGSVAGVAAQAASVSQLLPAGPYNLTGLKLHYVLTVDGVETDAEFTFTGDYADADELAAALVIPGVVVTNSSGTLVLTTEKTGSDQALVVKADGTANGVLDFNTGADTSDTGSDVTLAGLSGKLFQFTLDGNPFVYEVPFISDRLKDAVEDINALVGLPVASITAARELLITSPLKGVASSVTWLGGSADTVLGTASAATPGSGRPLPDAWLDVTGALNINSQLVRDAVTGAPLSPAYNSATLYVSYRALRLDVTALAAEPGVLRIGDVGTLASELGPLTEENPLGLGLLLGMLAAPRLEFKALGVDEVTGTSPEGTVAAWARAAGLLETEEVYALATLTHDEAVHDLFKGHVNAMSAPEQAGERIYFPAKLLPTRKNPTVAANGAECASTATPNELVLDSNPAPGLVQAGLNPADALPLSAGVYVELEVSGERRRYSVERVNGALVKLRTAFTTSENQDAFYSSVTLNTAVTAQPWSLQVRGAPLTVPGSDRLDYGLMAETVADANRLIQDRRVFELFPDTVKAQVGGIEKELPGYYAGAIVAGMVAFQPPQQGLTNMVVPGLTGVVGTERFSEKQLRVLCGGGTFVLQQDTPDGPVYVRHQLSTDTTSKEKRELSVTKTVDYVAKLLRNGVRKFIGTHVVNESLLDNLGTAIQGMLKDLEERGILNGWNLNNLIQDASNPDTVLVDVTLAVPYPCNYIKLTVQV